MVGVHSRYEISFEGTLDYPNPTQDVQVTIEFASYGETRIVEAFWDGGHTWRARFSPDLSGPWTWRSCCSAPQDSGLHNRRGEFECAETNTPNSLSLHGPIRLSASRRHLIHADGEPFFWLADTAWNGPLKSDESEWAIYLSDRAQKGFNVIQFVATQWIGAAGDANGLPAYRGREPIRMEPAFFQRLDRRIDMINDFGMIAAPVLAWAAAWNPDSVHLNPGNTLCDEQLVVLIRYLVSRYGAHQAIWILAGDGIYAGDEAERWRRIGRAALNFTNRAATMHPAGKVWVAPEFRCEPWFHLNGYQSSHDTDNDTFRWMNQGPPSIDWATEPMCPHVNLEPCYEDHIALSSAKRIDAHDVRRACYWSLLATPPAGITYGAHGVWSWETDCRLPLGHPHSGITKPWHEAIHLPGSYCMKYLKDIFRAAEWWRLRPCHELLNFQPGKEFPARFISAACSEDRKVAMIYCPEGGPVQLNPNFCERGLKLQCFDPENGTLLWERPCCAREKNIETGGPGDRVLILQAS
jgi:hypothetical protein